MKKIISFCAASVFSLFLLLVSSGTYAGEITQDDAFYLVAGVAEQTGMMAEQDQTINGEPCYIIAVGDNKPEQFVVSKRYAVGKKSKKIYVYDIISDSFSPVEHMKK